MELGDLWEYFFHKKFFFFAQIQGIQKALNVENSQFLIALEDKLF